MAVSTPTPSSAIAVSCGARRFERPRVETKGRGTELFSGYKNIERPLWMGHDSPVISQTLNNWLRYERDFTEPWFVAERKKDEDEVVNFVRTVKCETTQRSKVLSLRCTFIVTAHPSGARGVWSSEHGKAFVADNGQVRALSFQSDICGSQQQCIDSVVAALRTELGNHLVIFDEAYSRVHNKIFDNMTIDDLGLAFWIEDWRGNEAVNMGNGPNSMTLRKELLMRIVPQSRCLFEDLGELPN